MVPLHASKRARHGHLARGSFFERREWVRRRSQALGVELATAICSTMETSASRSGESSASTSTLEDRLHERFRGFRALGFNQVGDRLDVQHWAQDEPRPRGG